MLKGLRIKFVTVIMLIVTTILVFVFSMIYKFTAFSMEQSSIGMMRTLASESVHLLQPEENSGDIWMPYFILYVDGEGALTGVEGYYELHDREFLANLAEAVLGETETSDVLEEYDLRYYRADTDEGQTLVFSYMTGEKYVLSYLAQTLVQIGTLCIAAFLGVSILLSVWMLRPVEKAWEQQRQFVSDASHELKTPLTIITTNAELLQNEQCSESERMRFSGTILDMSRQMRMLVERLLVLARVDKDSVNPELLPIDLSELVENAMLPFEAIFFERGLELESRIEPGITVQGIDHDLHQVVGILLDNARKYALDPGKVVLRLERTGPRRCWLTISNPAEGMTQEQLGGIFTRFYRLDSARSRDGSFGLGLPIARGIVKQHQGKIWAESNSGIVTFFVELPTK